MATDPPNPSLSTPASKVSQETIQRAVNALLKWKDSQSNSEKPQLLSKDDLVYLILTLNKIPPRGSGRTSPYKIPLPHPLLLQDSLSELCLIIDDRPSSKLTSDFAKKKVKSEEIPVSKVIKLSKLKTDYKPFEAKRKLCDSYDLFFADKRVIPLLPKILGKQFFKKKKLPLGVDLTHNNWKEQIERACSSALLYLKSTGTCSVVRIGRVEMEREEIVENVAAAIDGVIEYVPKKWAGVRSLHLKLSESVALPLYQALSDMKLKIEGIKVNVEGVKAEEDGGLTVVKESSKKDEKLRRKKGSEKGRIHEVRYMDANLGEVEVGSDNDVDAPEAEKSENDDLGSAEVLPKKRKNRDALKRETSKEKKKNKAKKGGIDEMGTVKRVSSKKKKSAV